jgi:ribosome-binding protein aMBF1 (putative translation factor)
MDTTVQKGVRARSHQSPQTMSGDRPFQDVLDDALKDPETRAEWDRTQLARDVSIWLLRYRRDHKLNQVELAEELGWKQPVIARLERGDQEPSIGTLQRLVERLGTRATIEIRPERVEVHFGRTAAHPRPSKRTSAKGAKGPTVRRMVPA